MSNFLLAGNGMGMLWLMIIMPSILALAIIFVPKENYTARFSLFLVALTLNAIAAIGLNFAPETKTLIPWAPYFNLDLAFRVYDFSSFIVLGLGLASLLVGIYSITYLKKKEYAGSFLALYLLTLALANGAVLANNLIIMLFFWEGLLITLFAMIVLGNKKDLYAAKKAFYISGFADLALMLGIGITAWLSGTTEMDAITPLETKGLATIGYVCMLIGALGKAGAMPFHSWIPDAANHAPLPFLAILPGAIEKLLGIYLLIRISFDFYNLSPGSGLSMLLMIIGSITIVFAVGMALIQKDMKRLLSYHAISQVGYMVLGIGTALPVGVVGGIFHMLNNAIYKSCLFMTAGAIELRLGTTDLRKIGGLARLMPFTAIAFMIAALSIAGVPPFNGFISKELIFDAAYETNIIFYIAALLGAFMTGASFLKMGHAAFFGKFKPSEDLNKEDIKEVPYSMTIPMLFLAALCLIFGVFNILPVSSIQQLLGAEFMDGHDYAGWHIILWMVLVSVAVLLMAVGNHIFGLRKTGEAIKAVDHIHYAPGLHNLYDASEKRLTDPYHGFAYLIKLLAKLCYIIDRFIDAIYMLVMVKIVHKLALSLSSLSNGSSSRYISWALGGVLLILIMFIILL